HALPSLSLHLALLRGLASAFTDSRYLHCTSVLTAMSTETSDHQTLNAYISGGRGGSGGESRGDGSGGAGGHGMGPHLSFNTWTRSFEMNIQVDSQRDPGMHTGRLLQNGPDPLQSQPSIYHNIHHHGERGM
ncbi:hypothetical protein C8R45DRAFT_195805, partial [Mycena sanguinolenta]